MEIFITTERRDYFDGPEKSSTVDCVPQCGCDGCFRSHNSISGPDNFEKSFFDSVVLCSHSNMVCRNEMVIGRWEMVPYSRIREKIIFQI